MRGRGVWRISNFKDFSSIGGTMVSGRWHHRGHPVVYLADCPATALLEVLVHFELIQPPSGYAASRAPAPVGSDSRRKRKTSRFTGPPGFAAPN
ncbi:RES family NAD+ phosphorylase [Halomonas sp. LBP4]|uniref:RES family NAD+ phosphorylase n=1 Tax=Halomonas sp. LBP4 TaxID=2044917 RepID=UPI000D76B65C|nr:hypothetical protein CR157_08285 [Halomonas sp. LBP4]